MRNLRFGNYFLFVLMFVANGMIDICRAEGEAAPDAATSKPSLQDRLDASLGNRPSTPSPDPPAIARQVQKLMDQARASVEEEDLSTAVQHQMATLKALDELLAGLNSGESPPATSEGASKTEQGGITQSPSPSQGEGQRPPNTGSALESNPNARPGLSADQIAEQRRRLATSVWGHLPDRVREQMSGNYREHFLPEYADLVEDYYRALAEEATRRR